MSNVKCTKCGSVYEGSKASCPKCGSSQRSVSESGGAVSERFYD